MFIITFELSMCSRYQNAALKLTSSTCIPLVLLILKLPFQWFNESAIVKFSLGNEINSLSLT